jgi:hypothetical protein
MRMRELPAALKAIEDCDPNALKPGPRAALAAIYEACGKADEADAIRKEISPEGLLPEEKAFAEGRRRD